MGSIIWFLVIGLVAGFAARALVPGKDAMGILPTILLGVVGSFLGGLLAVLFTDRKFDDFGPSKIIGSIIGAIVALLIYRFMKAKAKV
jgi:uncharacterized membrane protein YeaQ/YmgE (transglycosylase-associated protein family)